MSENRHQAVVETAASALARKALCASALKRLAKDPDAYGAISVEEALSKGLVTEDDLKPDPERDSEILAEAEIGWRAEDEERKEGGQQ